MMKSLFYLLFGKPKNLSDCIEFSKKAKPKNVEIDLFVEPNTMDFADIYVCSARFTWYFPGFDFSFFEYYGGVCFSDFSDKQIIKEKQHVNHKLKKDLRILAENSIPFSPEDLIFFPEVLVPS